MTIEERAKEAQTQMPKTSSPYVMFRDGYIKGATEQKAIYEKRIAELESFVERATKLIEAEKAFREHLEAKEKKQIDKACEWLEENQAHIVSESGVWLMWTAFLKDFRKAMEAEI